MYEMEWKVKKEIPIGSRSAGTATGLAPRAPSATLRFSARKPEYLNVTSDSRLSATMPRSSIVAAGVPRRRSIQMAAVVFTRIEPRITQMKAPPSRA